MPTGVKSELKTKKNMDFVANQLRQSHDFYHEKQRRNLCESVLSNKDDNNKFTILMEGKSPSKVNKRYEENNLKNIVRNYTSDFEKLIEKSTTA